MHLDALSFTQCGLCSVRRRRAENRLPAGWRYDDLPYPFQRLQREGHGRHSARRDRADGDARGAQTLREKFLHNETAERVADEHRWFGLRADDRGVVRYDFIDSHSCQSRVRVRDLLVRGTALTGPGGRQRVVAPIREKRREESPAQRRGKRPVDKNNSVLVFHLTHIVWICALYRHGRAWNYAACSFVAALHGVSRAGPSISGWISERTTRNPAPQRVQATSASPSSTSQAPS